MADQAEEINATKRQTLQRMLGIGAGLAMPAGLLAQEHAPTPQHKRSQLPVAAPPHTSAAGSFRPGALSGVYDVRAFGATGDGKTLDTPAINKAVVAAAAAGGGAVVIPAGTYLCYSIRLKSRVALYLDQGATILAAEPEEAGKGYDPPEPGPNPQYQDFGHSHWHNALIWGVGLEDVSILGPGLIWGKGLRRSIGRNPNPAGLGDKAISLKSCRNVTLRDFSILQGGHFGILATAVDNFTIDNLKIDTNRDAMDIDCCQNVRVSNCTVNSPWDDGICPKSSYALGYARPTKNLTIVNCYVTGGYELGTVLDGTFKRFAPGIRVPRNGRIKCGTESNGGFQNITISNCVWEDCQGLALETVDGALLEDISISNVTMREIVNPPIFLRLGSRMRGPAGTPVGVLRRVSISNVVATNTSGRYASIIAGIPGYEIEDVRLSGIYITSQGGGTKVDAAVELPEKESAYPEPTMFGATPCYAFFIRHVKGIDLSNVEVRYLKEDLRPAFVLTDVQGADFTHVRARHAVGAPSFSLKNVRNFNTYLSGLASDVHLERVEEKTL